jgi:hypothetical protein
MEREPQPSEEAPDDWILISSDEPRGRGAFGTALATDGAELWIGAPGSTQGLPTTVRASAGHGQWERLQRWTSRTEVAGPDDVVVVDGVEVPIGQYLAKARGGLGRAMAVSDDVAVIGGAGRALVLRRTGELWGKPTWLVPEDADRGDDFGVSVALARGVVAVGAPGTDVADYAHAGAVHLFRLVDDDWVFTTRLSDSAPAAEARLGAVLAGQGDLLVAGTGRRTTGSGGPSAGFAVIFERVGEAMLPVHRVEALHKDAWAFGTTVAVDGDLVAVGGDAVVALHRREAAGWRALPQLSAPPVPEDLDRSAFARSMALRDGLLLVGEPASWQPEILGSAWLFSVDKAPRMVERWQVLDAPLSEGRFGDAVALGEGVAYVSDPARMVGVKATAGVVWRIPIPQ